MRFFCVIRSLDNLGNSNTLRLLENSVKERGIEWHLVEAEKMDISTLADWKSQPGDILYRLSIGDAPSFAEALMMQDGVASFYRKTDDVFARAFNWSGALRMMRAGVSIIPTRFEIPISDDDAVMKGVESLGGFPVVVKVSGGSHGSGVRKADSLEELKKYVSELDEQSERLVLRKFVANARHIRCVVVGDKVVDAIEYLPVEGDFRTNAVAEPKVIPFEKNEAIFELAEAAVKADVTEFGGVDILIGDDGVAYVAEVNYPCNFARNQMLTGVDVSGAMVEYLAKKLNIHHKYPLKACQY